MKWNILFVFFSLNSCVLFSQISERSTFAVFAPITVNDTVLVAGGQTQSGTGEDEITVGYYPFQQTLLTIPQENERPFLVKTFPNPFQEAVFVEFENKNELLLTIEVLDLSGAVVFRLESSNKLISIASDRWESGLYLVRIIEPEGEVLYSEKLVKT